MKISDLTCPSCSASYEVAESTSAQGGPGRAPLALAQRAAEAAGFIRTVETAKEIANIASG